MTLQQMITLWLMGNRTEHVLPLRYISPKDVADFDRKGKNLNKMKNCIEVMKRVTKRNGVWSPNNAPPGYWNGCTVCRLWDGVVADILPHLRTKTEEDDCRVYCNKSKPMVLAWRTNADKLVALGLSV